MNESIITKANAFKGINELAMKGEIVVFGSTYMANFPFYELINKSNLENAVYNRSIEHLNLDDADALLETCVLDIKPSKVFIALGEEDYQNPSAITKYNNIVRKIRAKLPDCTVYLISIPFENEQADAFNKNIQSLCDNKKIISVSFARTETTKAAQYKLQFKELTHFFRNKPVSFSDAFSVANI